MTSRPGAWPGVLAVGLASLLSFSQGGCGGSESKATPRASERSASPRHRGLDARATPKAQAQGPSGPSLPLGVKDKGIFGHLQSRVRLRVPRWVSRATTSLLVNKAKRALVLLHRGVAVKVYPIALGSQPVGHKKRQGDGKTPEGVYTLVEALDKNLAPHYGARSLRLSYPSPQDSLLGLRSGLIGLTTHRRILAAHRAGRIPPQTTALGGSLRIHGGGVGRDWTLGCIAMRDPDIVELYRHVGLGTKVIVSPAHTPSDRDRDGIPDQVDILIGAKKTVANGARYDGRYVSLRYPMGDVPSHIGVCTDVVIRALRNAGFDLQRLVSEDIGRSKRSYRIAKIDRNIDHRRVKNLLPFFLRHFKLINTSIGSSNMASLLPGDIVFMDTLPGPGPDHIGVVSDLRSPNGYPKVINNWTVGHRTAEMDLLPEVRVTHHFRIAPKAP